MTPNPPPAQHPPKKDYTAIWIGAIAFGLMFLSCGAVAFLTGVSEFRKNKEALSKPKSEPPRISAIVAYDQHGVLITNGDQQRPLRSVQLKLNVRQWGANSGVASVGDIAPGKT